MRSLYLLVLIAVLPVCLSAGKEKKEPEFIGMKNTRIGAFSFKKIDIYTEAVFYNPYRVGVKLEEVLIDVFVGGKKLGTILNSEEGVKIRKKGTFEIPLRLSVKPGPTFVSLFAQSGRLLVGKKVEIAYKGHVKVRALGFVPVKVKIDDKEYYDWDDLFPDKKEQKEMEKSIEKTAP